MEWRSLCWQGWLAVHYCCMTANKLDLGGVEAHNGRQRVVPTTRG